MSRFNRNVQIQQALERAIHLVGGRVDFPGVPLWSPGESEDEGFTVIPVATATPEMGVVMPIPEATDLKFVGNVSSLPSIASGVGSSGTEVKFGVPGIIIPAPGAAGAFWARPLGARWAGVQPGRPIAYTPELGVIFAKDSAVPFGGQLILEFYGKPPGESMQDFYHRVRIWNSQTSTESGAGFAAAIAGFFPGSAPDVTLGTFTQTGGTPTQIFLAGTNMPVGGATKAGGLVLGCPAANTDDIFVGETSALAVASNNPLSPTGQDTWNIGVNGKAFFLSKTGTQTVSARFRS